MNNEKIKKIENFNNDWIAYHATEDGFDYETAMEIVNTLTDSFQVETFKVQALLFFGYCQEVLSEDIAKVNECLEVFTEYKLALTEIQYSDRLQEITFVFE